jgi:HEAT repeat protein
MPADSEDLQALLEELSSGDDQRAEGAVHALASQGESVLPWLCEELESDNPDQRWWATAALAQIDHEQARAALKKSLTDPDPSVRQCAAFGLRRQPYQAALPDLVEALGGPDRLLARLAADALASLGENALESLTKALRSENPAVRIEAARALSQMQDHSAIPPLFAALDDPSPLVVHWAERGLEKLGVGMMFFKPG